MNEKVELFPAFSWNCPDCGTEQFGRIIVSENPNLGALSEGMMAMDQDGEVIGPISGSWELWPESVQCERCQKEFPVESFEDEDEDNFGADPEIWTP